MEVGGIEEDSLSPSLCYKKMRFHRLVFLDIRSNEMILFTRGRKEEEEKTRRFNVFIL